jgi:REP element-mobilizing transposase RayT
VDEQHSVCTDGRLASASVLMDMQPSEPSNSVWSCRGYLPHLVVPGIRQFVTFSLADALPHDVRLELVERDATAAETEDRLETLRVRERMLDRGLGACLLGRPECAEIVAAALRHFDGDRYALLAWVVMPNHVHAAVHLESTRSIDNVVQSWKSYTAKEINRRRGATGRFWRRDYFDARIRDDEHLTRVRRYIEWNPVAAKLCDCPERWRFSSAFRG